MTSLKETLFNAEPSISQETSEGLISGSNESSFDPLINGDKNEDTFIYQPMARSSNIWDDP